VAAGYYQVNSLEHAFELCEYHLPFEAFSSCVGPPDDTGTWHCPENNAETILALYNGASGNWPRRYNISCEQQDNTCPAGTVYNPGTPYTAPSCDPKNNKNAGVPTAPQLCHGNPIHIGTGNKFQREVDYRSEGTFPLRASRFYNSDVGSWRFFPEIQTVSAGTEVELIRADGKGLPFRKEGGSWISDPDVVGTLTASEDGSGNITGWSYTSSKDQVESYDAQGRLQSITARNGLSHSYAYATDSITVTHSGGALLIYQLDVEGRVTGFTDPDYNSYQYGYDGEGRLTGITLPDDTPGDSSDNPQRLYHYENSSFPYALTGITDENGNRYATWSYDANGRAASSEHAGGADSTTIDYTHVDDASDPRVTVTNPLGKQTTYHLTTLHDVYKVVSVEGHPTADCLGANKAYTYDANGFLASKTDWEGVVTSYTRDGKGRELSRTEAVGTPEERTITTEWHSQFRLPTRITEPGKITEFTYDTQGNLLSRQERSNP
jgi:YD repeat-containing protein